MGVYIGGMSSLPYVEFFLHCFIPMKIVCVCVLRRGREGEERERDRERGR